MLKFIYLMASEGETKAFLSPEEDTQNDDGKNRQVSHHAQNRVSDSILSVNLAVSTIMN